VTSLGQSVSLYGVPYFWKDSGGNEFHGDARNEYGLMALNQFISVGNRAYVVRANVDLTDATEQFVGVGTPVASDAVLFGIGNGTIGHIVAASAFVRPETISVVFTSSTNYTVVGSVSGIIGTGSLDADFISTKVNFTITEGSVPFNEDDYFQFDLVYTSEELERIGNGKMVNILPDSSLLASSPVANETWTITFISDTDYEVSGSASGQTSNGLVGVPYDNNYVNFLINAGDVAFAAGDMFRFTLQPVNLFNPLGANDAAKRVAIATALAAEINSNTEVRSEMYEYNLIVAPGFPEVVDDLVALSVDVNEEAFVIADTPVNKTPEQTAVWSMTSERVSSNDVAYYFPWGLASNLDGRNVVCAPSGIALRTYAYSDNQSYVWFAPAGARRGVVTGIQTVGFVSGTLGTATTFVESNLSQGQRDNLYEFGKNVNPIVFFPGQGLLIWGQKTSAPGASALDRVNVVRLVMYLKRALRKGAFPFVFEPNDKITRDNLKSAADGLLNDVLAKRGLYDFVTLCDESNNTPQRIENNELYLDVAIKPVKAAEFIYIPMRVLSTGASMK
jgi:hypothetical protein